MHKKHFYTNGIVDKKFSDTDTIPEGFYRGRTNGCGAFTANRYAINNGKQCKFIPLTDPIPDGWVMGLLKHTDEHNSKISAALKGKIRSEEHCKNLSLSHKTDKYKNKIRNTLLERYGVDNAFKADFVKAKCNTPEVVNKRFTTMKQNNTIAKSKVEDRYYEHLVNLFGKDQVIRQYKSDEYPFSCDFYICEIKLYIEINHFWTHGKHPFDINNADDLETLENWKNKSCTSKYFMNAIYNWTIRDVTKFSYLNENNLNYLLIYPDSITTNQGDEICEKIILK